MTDPNVWPPQRTADDPLGKPFDIQQKDFYGVHDPEYPWVGMDHSSPSQWRKWKQLQTSQKAEIDHYVVVRSRYWNQTNRISYGAETQATYTYEIGTTYTHTKTTQDSTTTRIGVDLGLNLGGDLFGGGDVPPIPPVAMAALPMNAATLLAADGDGSGGENPSGGSDLSANFSWEFSHTLDITTTDERSYTQTRSVSKTMNFLADYQYIYWQITETLTMYRVPMGFTDAVAIAAGNSIGHVTSKTPVVYVQPFNMDPSSGDDGDV